VQKILHDPRTRKDQKDQNDLMPAGVPTPSKPVKPSKPKRPRPTQDESVNAVRMQNWNREMLAWEAAIEQHTTAMQQREADKAAGRHA
jgi:hypothetical protein